MRDITDADLVGFDAVIHLAELSNDPLGENNPILTHSINHLGAVNLAKNAKRAGVSRFIYMSSCSVYGLGSGDFLTEESPVKPQTAYAVCKTLVEKDVMQLADESFSPVFLRNATAYGASPRMRFDIVLNNLSGLAWTSRKITMTSDGTPWRPLVHVMDICTAIRCALEAPRNDIHNQVFNVGDNAANFRVREIAEIVAAEFPGCELSIGSSAGDYRSYRVIFDNIPRELPVVTCAWDAKKGAGQLREIFARTAMDKSGFEFRAFTRLKQLKHLIATQQIDDSFFWRF